MPYFGSISRRDLIAALRRAGFGGPSSGGNHQYMYKADIPRLKIPNPHRGDISIGLLKEILEQAHISRAEWEKL